VDDQWRWMAPGCCCGCGTYSPCPQCVDDTISKCYYATFGGFSQKEGEGTCDACEDPLVVFVDEWTSSWPCGVRVTITDWCTDDDDTWTLEVSIAIDTALPCSGIEVTLTMTGQDTGAEHIWVFAKCYALGGTPCLSLTNESIPFDNYTDNGAGIGPPCDVGTPTCSVTTG